MDSKSIMDAINTLAGTYANNIPLPTISSLNFTAPSVGDISGKWQEFLQRAAKDPDIVNYYTNLLEQAKGDTQLAISYLEKDYQMGVRQTTDNLQANLQAQDLTFGQEDREMANNLNQRGIALTDTGPSQASGQSAQIEYAGGGLPKTELSTLSDSQKLRQEAEQRTATQGIEKMGLSRQKGVTGAGQQLQQYSTDLQKNKETDILGRAQTYFGAWQNQQQADAANKFNQQTLGGGSSNEPFGGYGDKNAWFKAKTGGEIAPVGWNG